MWSGYNNGHNTSPTPNVRELLGVEYLGGYLDATANFHFHVQQTDDRVVGYRIVPELLVLPHDDGALELLKHLFTDLDVPFQHRGRSDRRGGSLVVEDQSGLERFFTFLGEHSIHVRRQWRFVRDTLLPARHRGETHDREAFYRLIDAIERLQPHRRTDDSVKYSTEFFRDEFGLERSTFDRIELPQPSVDRVSERYLGGFFDGNGRFSLSVSRDETYDIGYALHVGVVMSGKRLDDAVFDRVQELLDRNGISSSVSDGSVRIGDRDGVASFVGLVGPHLASRHERAAFLYDHALPALKSGVHLTRDGFLDLLRALEERLLVQTGRRTYDASYFEDKWAEHFE